MNGTFKNGDILTLAFASINNLKNGDVIVFRSQRFFGKEVVHRVIGRNSFGVFTRGDSVNKRDPGVINQNAMIGRVSHRERKGRVSVVHGGRLGRVKGKSLNIYWNIRRWLGRSIEKPYSRLKHSGIVKLFWNPNVIRIQVASENGRVIHFIHNSRIVARSWPEQNRFECRKPWDLVL